MLSTIKKILIIPLLCLLILSLENCCYDCCDDCYDGKVWGYRPVYSNRLSDIVSLEDSQPLSRPGKIFIYNDYLLVNELQKGVHIIDNSDPINPTPLHFLKIAGNNDVAVKNGILYADQFSNLVTIRLDSLSTKFTDRIATTRLMDVFDSFNEYDIAPDESEVYYECPNPDLGVVVDWVQDSVEYACYNY